MKAILQNVSSRTLSYRRPINRSTPNGINLVTHCFWVVTIHIGFVVPILASASCTWTSFHQVFASTSLSVVVLSSSVDARNAYVLIYVLHAHLRICCSGWLSTRYFHTEHYHCL